MGFKMHQVPLQKNTDEIYIKSNLIVKSEKESFSSRPSVASLRTVQLKYEIYVAACGTFAEERMK